MLRIVSNPKLNGHVLVSLHKNQTLLHFGCPRFWTWHEMKIVCVGGVQYLYYIILFAQHPPHTGLIEIFLAKFFPYLAVSSDGKITGSLCGEYMELTRVMVLQIQLNSAYFSNIVKIPHLFMWV